MQHTADLENAWKAFERAPDASTFEAFYIASRETAARVAWRALGDAEWMEDAMQALFARLWQDRASRRIPAGLSAREALVRWTMNECRTLNRRRARTAKREAPFEAAANHPAPGQAPDEAADHRMIAEAVRRLLGTLPDPYREALLACEVEGATHIEAGKVLGIPARTVQTHVRRGREMLSRKLRKAGITLPVGAVLAVYAADAPASVSWLPAGDLIAGAPRTVATAGAIAPSESVAATSVFTLPAMATAAACVAGVAVLVWMLAAPVSPSGGGAFDQPALSDRSDQVVMVNRDAGADEPRTGTDEARTGTDEVSSTVSATGVDEVAMAGIESGSEPGQVSSIEMEAMGGTYPAMGRIISAETREGIPGAMIGLMLYSVGLDAEDLPRFTDREIKTRSDVVTAEDGTFTIQLPESKSSDTHFFLFARAEGFANQAVWLWPSIWEPLGKPTIVVSLPSEGSLAGRVEGPNGEPLSNFVVGFPILSPFDFAPMLEKGYLNAAAAVTVTDSKGAFRLAGLPAGKTMELPVVHDDWPAHFEQGVLVGASGLTVTIPTRGETVRGTVSEGDTPLEGWTVAFSKSNMEDVSDFTRALASVKTATTGRDGRYEIRGILPGVYTVFATSADLKSRDSFDDTIVAGHSEEIDISIDPSVMIELHFTAVDVETGEPVAGVQLATLEFHTEIPGRRPMTRTPPGTVVTDHEGRATLTVAEVWMVRGQVPEILLPVGYVAGPGTYRGFSKLFGYYGHRFDPDETHTIHLKRGSVLHGTVLEVDGAPAADAWVHTTSDSVGVDCDEQGRFSLTLTGAQSDLVIIRSARGGLVHPYPIGESPAPIEVQVQPYGMISGVYKDSTGRGIANVGLQVE